MTRGKPSLLSRPAGSQARADKKLSAESAFKAGELPKNPPAALKDAPAGRAAWRALMRAHGQLPGELFNGLDRDCLLNYCLAVEARAQALTLAGKVAKLFDEGTTDLQSLLKVRAELRMATRLVGDLEKQLYATPKSRGGVSPAKRSPSPEEVIEHELYQLDRILED